jgi:Flp pilus assembly pilin Flp
MFKRFWNDESGVVISAELALVLTIAVIAVIVGLSEVAVAVNTELNDVSNAIGSLDQSYFFTGMCGHDQHSGKMKSMVSGSRFNDSIDDCDRNTSCDIVTGPPRWSTGG